MLAACGPSRQPGVIYLPSAGDVVDRMLVLADVGAEDVVYDLGCGDGRIPIAAAKRYGARGVCVDIVPARIAESRRNAERAGVTARMSFEEGDLFETDLRQATVVALYLSPALNRRLRPKLFRELRPGARVISHNFDMGEWRSDTLERVAWPAGTTSTIHRWVIPADADGSWSVDASINGTERDYLVRFEQQFQEITGTASRSGRSVRLTGAELAGDRIIFTLTDTIDGDAVDLRFAGSVAAASMNGTVAASGATSAGEWGAERAPR